jgi:hypothetical protein
MTGVVQCGWCPVLLANDHTAWIRHHQQVHGQRGGNYSIRHIVSSDWDIRELDPVVPAAGPGNQP